MLGQGLGEGKNLSNILRLGDLENNYVHVKHAQFNTEND